MSLFNILDIAGSGMMAQNVRLNTTASNVANANSVTSSAGDTYRAREPVFAAQLQQQVTHQHGPLGAGINKDLEALGGVRVAGIVESNKPLIQEYAPNHPMANEEGYIFKPNVNVVEEMANMISASRSYQANVEVADAAKNLAKQTLRLGK
ncbi:flagellar basal body rod protein FlgC [Ferrimonas sediminicola]|uniref:Flagellar basal-body rod protein FlgC n=1 Tax=Ferrimonas sediminicola TaxID=2569538 RepID=A0A4U1B959_9GAMM|nr:flagellar basal body rod protein FlgC [Ferrimonas sediminicola]TKB47261.1 flagellar basal body rod protein FlgC [Ferrimonas sediminicola]